MSSSLSHKMYRRLPQGADLLLSTRWLVTVLCFAFLYKLGDFILNSIATFELSYTHTKSFNAYSIIYCVSSTWVQLHQFLGRIILFLQRPLLATLMLYSLNASTGLSEYIWIHWLSLGLASALETDYTIGLALLLPWFASSIKFSRK